MSWETKFDEDAQTFLEYLECKLHLAEAFIYGTHPIYDRTSDRHIFKSEFTFESWKSGKVGRLLYNSPAERVISTYLATGLVIDYSNTAELSFKYSIYRSIPFRYKIRLVRDKNGTILQ